tara:strand:+ start:97 stop:813 length:717 start_codon:yes stop_codon:yes gene_type:complete
MSDQSNYSYPLLIGIVGQNRVGKDTLSNYLVSQHQFTQYSLAQPIKDVARILFDFNEEQLEGNDKEKIDEEWGISPRQFFQQFGTEIMQKNIYQFLPGLKQKIPLKTFWITKTIKKIKKDRDNKINKHVISDVRFLHEAKQILEMGGYLIKIERPSKEEILENNDFNDMISMCQIEDEEHLRETLHHESQTQVNDISDQNIYCKIINKGTLKEFQINIEKEITKILSHHEELNDDLIA